LITNNLLKKNCHPLFNLEKKRKEKFLTSEFFFGLRDYNYFTTHTLLNNHSCLLAKAADTNLAPPTFA
jgi:hypothetical protein